MLEDLRMTKEYRAVRLFNYKTEAFHDNLKKCSNNFIVIDNADILLNDEDRKFINFNADNQYMLFSRNCDGLNVSAASFTVLHETGYMVSLERELAVT